jgi:hypothetical protein
MNAKSIYYIETTLNGYITKKIKITEWDKKKDYYGELTFNYENQDYEYYNDFSGDTDELDKFLKHGFHSACRKYQNENHLETKPNVYLEYWKTDSVGWYDDRYVGITIE